MTLNPDFDTQAAKNPAWRIDLDRWEHAPKSGAEPIQCDQLRPHYNGDNPRWSCASCSVPVRVKP